VNTEICHHLKSHGVIVYPTDTLYGLGAYAFDTEAIEKIFRLKRMEPRVLSVAFDSFESAENYAYLPEWVSEILPGPVTIIARAKGEWKYIVKDGKIGIRVPDNETALQILRECGPLTSTSANMHGQKEMKDIAEIKRIFGHDVLYVEGEAPKYKMPSTIIDVVDGKILREGAMKITDYSYFQTFG